MANTKNVHTLTVEASTKHLAKVRDFVAAHAENAGLSPEEISDVRLAVDEAYTNIIKHAYNKTAVNDVDIEIGNDGHKLWISLMDQGQSFDPSSYSEPDLVKRIKEKKRGGMGVYLIKKLMDQVQYSRSGKTNKIHMVKNL